MPEPERLTLYGKESVLPAIQWGWADEQLRLAGTYWLTTPGAGHPHVRPVWGLWSGDRLHLSVGSPSLAAGCAPGAPVTVHLDSATDVVVVEATVVGSAEDEPLVVAYNAKYDWDYTVAEYGPLTTLAPSKVLAWRSAGWAGRGGFQRTARWRF